MVDSDNILFKKYDCVWDGIGNRVFLLYWILMRSVPYSIWASDYCTNIGTVHLYYLKILWFLGTLQPIALPSVRHYLLLVDLLRWRKRRRENSAKVKEHFGQQLSKSLNCFPFVLIAWNRWLG